jgi:hypothetical protein
MKVGDVSRECAVAKRRTAYRTYGAVRQTRPAPRRRKPKPPPPFKAWGVALSFLAGLLAWIGAWTSAGFVLLALAFYLLALRLTRCRVQTWQDTPCKWLVRGLVGTCDWHRGLKRGLPHLVPVPQSVLPRFMWLRPDAAATTAAVPTAEPQPAAGARDVDLIAPVADQPGYAWAMLALAAMSALVGLLGFVYQVVSG